MTVYTFDLIIIVALLLASMGLTVATGITLSGRIRDLRDEVLAAGLARDDLDRRTLGDPRGGNDEDEPRGRGGGDWVSAPAEGALAEFETRLAAVGRRLATRRAELHELTTSCGELGQPAGRAPAPPGRWCAVSAPECLKPMGGRTCIASLADGWINAPDLCPECTRAFMAALDGDRRAAEVAPGVRRARRGGRRRPVVW